MRLMARTPRAAKCSRLCAASRSLTDRMRSWISTDTLCGSPQPQVSHITAPPVRICPSTISSPAASAAGSPHVGHSRRSPAVIGRGTPGRPSAPPRARVSRAAPAQMVPARRMAKRACRARSGSTSDNSPIRTDASHEWTASARWVAASGLHPFHQRRHQLILVHRVSSVPQQIRAGARRRTPPGCGGPGLSVARMTVPGCPARQLGRMDGPRRARAGCCADQRRGRRRPRRGRTPMTALPSHAIMSGSMPSSPTHLDVRLHRHGGLLDQCRRSTSAPFFVERARQATRVGLTSPP